MSRIITILSIFLLAVTLATAGCIVEDVQTEGPKETPLAGDPILGTWTGGLTTVSGSSGTGDVTITTTTYHITVEETGDVTFAYREEKRNDVSSVTNERMNPGIVSKTDNVYTLTLSSLGTAVITLLDDGTAELTNPDGKVCTIEKQTP